MLLYFREPARREISPPVVQLADQMLVFGERLGNRCELFATRVVASMSGGPGCVGGFGIVQRGVQRHECVWPGRIRMVQRLSSANTDEKHRVDLTRREK